MSMGSDLQASFRQASLGYLSSRSSVREVDLFRFLIEAFKSLPSYSVAEIHGNRRQVTFNATKGWYSKSPRCELGDIAILVYSIKKRQGRLVIRQNKVSRNSTGYFCGNYTQVNVNLVQHELLTVRPTFYYVRSPYAGVSNNLIQSSRYPSVCLYGNFYLSTYGEIDMSSFTANQLVFRTPISSMTRTSRYHAACTKYNGKLETISSRANTGDFVGAENLINFGDLLEDLYIGKPISCIEKRKINNELFFAMQSHAASFTASSTKAIKDFIEVEFITETDYYDNQDYQEDFYDRIFDKCRSLLIVNVDSIEHIDKPRG